MIRLIRAGDSPAKSAVADTLIFDFHKVPTHGYEATREAAMAAFAKSWRRE